MIKTLKCFHLMEYCRLWCVINHILTGIIRTPVHVCVPLGPVSDHKRVIFPSADNASQYVFYNTPQSKWSVVMSGCTFANRPKMASATWSHFACPENIFLKSILRAMQLRDCKDTLYHLSPRLWASNSEHLGWIGGENQPYLAMEWRDIFQDGVSTGWAKTLLLGVVFFGGKYHPKVIRWPHINWKEIERQ